MIPTDGLDALRRQPPHHKPDFAERTGELTRKAATSPARGRAARLVRALGHRGRGTAGGRRSGYQRLSPWLQQCWHSLLSGPRSGR